MPESDKGLRTHKSRVSCGGALDRGRSEGKSTHDFGCRVRWSEGARIRAVT
jgi:hypothetical protein